MPVVLASLFSPLGVLEPGGDAPLILLKHGGRGKHGNPCRLGGFTRISRGEFRSGCFCTDSYLVEALNLTLNIGLLCHLQNDMLWGTNMLRSSLCCLIISLCVCSSQADEPNPRYRLSQRGEARLNQFRIGKLKPLASKKAKQVRGQGGIASSNGLSLVVGAIVDPTTSSSLVGVDSNSAVAILEICGPVSEADPFHQQQSSLNLELNINEFSAGLIGGAGGAGTSLFR
jgi:hypothetical protein